MKITRVLLAVLVLSSVLTLNHLQTKMEDNHEIKIASDRVAA